MSVLMSGRLPDGQCRVVFFFLFFFFLSVSLSGRLPDGQYRVYVMVYTGHPDSSFQADCGAARVTGALLI